MHLTYRNVNSAFYALVKGIHGGEIPTTRKGSRYGDVMQVEEPVLITYTHPMERVLLNAQRDCNPFFALYEALHMLAGRRDVAPLVYYNSRMKEFSDDGKVFNGAYGYRWRRAPRGVHALVQTFEEEGDYDSWMDADFERGELDVDQLDILVAHLKAKPDSRRAVLQMWEVESDLLKIDTSKDVCCLAYNVSFRSPEGDTSIRELARRFQSDEAYKYPVYSVDTITGDQRLSWMTAAWRTGVRETKRLTLDDGSEVRLTGDHRVFRKRRIFDGKRCVGISITECLVCDLKPGDSLLSEMHESSSARSSGGNYRVFKRNIFKNTSWSNMRLEHREYHEFVTGEPAGDDDIHHKNGNKTDNRFDNLERLSVVEHQRHHKTGPNNPHCRMSVEAKKRRGRIHSAVMQNGGTAFTPPHVQEVLNRRPPYRTEEQNVILWDWVCSLSNHKVVTIEDGGAVPVYDFTVPGRHNAVLSNGVVVHNCNTSVMFSLREKDYVETVGGLPHMPNYYLDMTVTNRSNDLVLGMLGANYVHFGVLLEYMAARLGAEVGDYNQFSNNVHCYTKGWEPEKWLSEYEESLDQVNRYDFHMMKLVKDPVAFEAELPVFVEQYSGGSMKDPFHKYTEPFLRFVAQPMMDAFMSYKLWSYGVMNHVDRIVSADWHQVCGAWMRVRLEKRKVGKEKANG